MQYRVTVMAAKGRFQREKSWTTEHDRMVDLLDEIAGMIRLEKCTAVHISIVML